ncbi:MAG: dihydropteroate synthase [Xanthomonadales bacterium]|nr:dihydropteroate synthase [Xanthomonadales bacterium]NNL94119.1 dihydropteroate synthase [Xanthomonadales bacterium]
MGVLNVTPDSFSDGGAWLSPREALMHAHRMAAAGADIIDVGGESTRPGAAEVSVQQELDRVIPVIEALWAETRLPISIDTSKAEVMREAAAAGAGMINDVCALRGDDAVEAAAELALPVCLMHLQGKPGSMQREPRYEDVCAEVTTFLLKRAEICINAGIARENIVLDPGFGFGKLLEHNLALLQGMAQLCGHGFPVLAGLSRKSMIGQITGREVSDRLAGSLALALLAAQQGASIVRVHDVAETADTLRVLEAFQASLTDPA